MCQYQRLIEFEPSPMIVEPLVYLCGKEKRKERRTKERKQNKR